MSGASKTSVSVWTVNACLLVAVVGTLWHFAVVSSPSQAFEQNDESIGPLMDAGVRIPIAELWKSSEIERTAVLLLDIGCWACLASRPFYGELDRIVADTPGTRLVILSNNPIPAVRKWLDEGGIRGRVVQIPSLMALGVLETPTLLLATSDGVVTDVSFGLLDEAGSANFKARLRGDVEAQPLVLPYSFKEASVSERPDVDNLAGIQLLDTRDRRDFEREYSAKAVNIPKDELAVRALVELSTSRPVFIDCRYDDRTQCRLAGGRLVRQGFASVTVLLR